MDYSGLPKKGTVDPRSKEKRGRCFSGECFHFSFVALDIGRFFKAPPTLVSLGKDPSASYASNGGPGGMKMSFPETICGFCLCLTFGSFM